MTTFQALSYITTTLNKPLPTFDDHLYGSIPLFQVTKSTPYTMPKKRELKAAKKIADQNSSSAILEPNMDE